MKLCYMVKRFLNITHGYFPIKFYDEVANSSQDICMHVIILKYGKEKREKGF